MAVVSLNGLGHNALILILRQRHCLAMAFSIKVDRATASPIARLYPCPGRVYRMGGVRQHQSDAMGSGTWLSRNGHVSFGPDIIAQNHGQNDPLNFGKMMRHLPQSKPRHHDQAKSKPMTSSGHYRQAQCGGPTFNKPLPCHVVMRFGGFNISNNRRLTRVAGDGFDASRWRLGCCGHRPPPPNGRRSHHLCWCKPLPPHHHNRVLVESHDGNIIKAGDLG